MAEPKIRAPFPNRRLQSRFVLSPENDASLQFRHPSPNGRRLTARMRDISLSGVSMTLPEELTGIQTGDILKGMEAKIAGKTFRGDLLVMHVSPEDEPGAVCGGLFYPEGDEDLITMRLVVRALEAAAKPIS